MPLFAPRCAKARFLSIVVLLALSREVAAQADQRDAVIQELRQRVEALEKKLGEQPAAPPPQTQAPPPPPAAPPPAAPTAPQPAAAAPTPSSSEEAATADENARALERTLVREGGLVLPRKVIEVEPRFQYTYRGTQGLNIATVNGVAQVVQQDVRRDDFEASLAIRAGLPWSMQAEVRLPYEWINQNRATSSAATESAQVSGWGDVELSLTKQFSTSRHGGLLGSLVWKPPSGQFELNRLSPGTGFHQLQAALNIVAREDPLVFFISPSYSWIFKSEKNGVDVDPGDAIGVKAGTLLAASPETSLRASFELSRTGRTRIAGSAVPGSDTTIGVLELGLAKVLTRSTLLDVSFGIGVTRDTPDLRLRIALPIRLGP
jgi:hypothetical protein